MVTNTYCCPPIHRCVNHSPIDTAGHQNNGVHPAAAGYQQIGDSLDASLNAQLAE